MSVNKNIKLIVRRIQLSDCEEVRQIWTILGFKCSKYDNEVMMKVDGEGILVAQDLNTGKLLGACAGVNHSPDLSHVGQYTCLNEYQNMGIGAQLWRTAMEHMGTDRNIGLLARKTMADKYREKWAFTFSPNKFNICFTGKVDCSQMIHSIDGISVVPLKEDNIKQVIAFDREVCDGLDRSVLIEENAKFDENVNRVAVNENNEVLGYCMLKVSNLNTGIVEPLYANDERIAELLLAKCIDAMAITQTNGLIYNCWNTNTKSIAIAEKLGLTVSGELPVHFNKKVVDGQLERIFCLSSRAFYPF